MEFVEVRGKSIDVAVQAAMQELQITDRDKLDVEVVQQPEKAVLGLFGGKDAVVRVTVKADDPRKRRRRRRKGGRPDEDGQPSGDGRDGQNRGQQGQQRGSGGGGGRQRQSGSQSGSQSAGQAGDRPGGQPRRDDRSRGREDGNRGEPRDQRDDRSSGARVAPEREERTVAIDEQVPVVKEFLTGLVDAFGLDGTVEVRADDDVIIADITGQQTQAMVGPRGSVIESIHELTKTVLHRQTQSSARLRLDIAGYGDRRRQALSIYAGQLIDQVLGGGGEVMLEPMSAADRKVIHDAVGEREGVRSYSEGESPQRYVVIAYSGAPIVASSEEE